MYEFLAAACEAAISLSMYTIYAEHRYHSRRVRDVAVVLADNDYRHF